MQENFSIVAISKGQKSSQSEMKRIGISLTAEIFLILLGPHISLGLCGLNNIKNIQR
jgi:hypothetical protein